MDVTPSSLMRASGNPTCAIMHKLLSFVVNKQGIKLTERIQYPEEYLYKEINSNENGDDMETEIPEDPILGMDGDYYDDSDVESDLDYEEYLKKGKSEQPQMFVQTVEPGDEDGNGTVTTQKVSVNDWFVELEHISPQLVVRLSVDLKNWRTHVENMAKQEKTINQLFNEVTKSLSRIEDDISKVLIRIKKRETMLNNDPSINTLLSSLRKYNESLKVVQQKYKIREEDTIKLSDELNALNEELLDMKRDSQIKEKELSDISKLTKIKESIYKIKQEIKEINLRAGVLMHSVLMAKAVATHRAMSASAHQVKEGIDSDDEKDDI